MGRFLIIHEADQSKHIHSNQRLNSTMIRMTTETAVKNTSSEVHNPTCMKVIAAAGVP